MLEVVPDAADIRWATARFVIGKSKGGWGVFARHAIPANTLVGPYPGTLFTRAGFSDAVARGQTTTTYGMDMWMVAPPTGNSGGAGGFRFVRPGEWVIDPGDARGQVRPEYSHAITPYINEPTLAETPNIKFVYNIPKHRIEFWTSRPVGAGKELLLCYGDKYARAYATACTTGNHGNSEGEHVIYTASQTVPTRLDTYRRKQLRDSVQQFGRGLSEARLAVYRDLTAKRKRKLPNAPHTPPPSRRRLNTPSSTRSNTTRSNGSNGSNGSTRSTRSTTRNTTRNTPNFSNNRRTPNFSSTVSNRRTPNSSNSAAWLAQMHAILDKPSVTDADVLQVGHLVKSQPRTLTRR